MFGLPWGTVFFFIGCPIIAIVLSFVYALTFKDNDEWLTIEDIFGKKNDKSEEK